ACGFDDDAAVAAYRAFSSFLLGHLLLEVSAQGADIGPVEGKDPSAAERADLDSYPRLRAMQSTLSQDHSAEEFEQSLESLLDRLESSLS
ncbi:MAG: TetR/AcrR family transcriptional regulator C-terminal domain-containing protein, partial [Mycobacteriaceae bacterium]